MAKYILKYSTDEGEITAEFGAFDEMEEFRKNLEKANEYRQEEIIKEAREEAEKLAEEIDRRWNEVKTDMQNAVKKAKDYGMSPRGVVELFRMAVVDLIDDKCDPAADEDKAGKASETVATTDSETTTVPSEKSK